MRKALAQNPNLLRTLVGLSLTLIIILAYAVYGASQNSDYYVYKTDANEDVVNITQISVQHYDNNGEEWTSWIWQFSTNPENLTWINSSVDTGVDAGELFMINSGEGYWSHPDLGDLDAMQFSCAESCAKIGTHSDILDQNGGASIVGLTDWDSARRDGGTVRAENIDDATVQASENVAYMHPDNTWQIRLEISGNHSEAPEVTVTQVNEKLSEIERFEIDPATELVWATFSVIGCFATLLVPAFGIYFASRAKERLSEASVETEKEDE